MCSDARFEMAGRARQDERHKISLTIRSQHKPMHATPGGLSYPRSIPAQELGVDARLKFHCVREFWLRGPHPKTPKRP
jgi:hypothetical protein